MSSAASRTSLTLFQRAWNEIPDVVAGTGLAILGLAMTTVGLGLYYANDRNYRIYKHNIVVIRSDDPRAEKIRSKE